jgi:hypothetical protein
VISVVIPTHESERLLVPTLAALVPGAVAGVVREVIVADAGSRDATATVADVAGCRFVVSPSPLGARLRAAAALARADWLLFLQPGVIPEASWVQETERFLQQAGGLADARAAVFRPGSGGSTLADALALLTAGLRRPKPHQGLLLARSLYERLGGHRDEDGDPEQDLLGRLDRRRIVVLASAVTLVRA